MTIPFDPNHPADQQEERVEAFAMNLVYPLACINPPFRKSRLRGWRKEVKSSRPKDAEPHLIVVGAAKQEVRDCFITLQTQIAQFIAL
jgi:hypothetical protein